jgi:hypothetical protein
MTRPPTEAALPGARRLGLGPSATNEKILKNEPAFAAVKRRATPATFNLVVWWRSRLGANKHVLCGAVRAVEARCFGHGEASLGPSCASSAPEAGRSPRTWRARPRARETSSFIERQPEGSAHDGGQLVVGDHYQPLAVRKLIRRMTR